MEKQVLEAAAAEAATAEAEAVCISPATSNSMDPFFLKSVWVNGQKNLKESQNAGVDTWQHPYF